MEAEANTLELHPEPQYERQVFYVVLSTTGTSEPKVLKREPYRLGATESVLNVHLLVPKRQKRVSQTIEITLPDEFAHVARIEVSVPSVEEVQS